MTMPITSSRALSTQILGILLLVTTQQLHAAQQSGPAADVAWPTKPVRVVVPFGAGGLGDMLARVLGEKLSSYNGQPFVIDNRPGAGGNIGAGVVARATPDGYQLLLVPGSVLTMNPSLYAQVPFGADSFALVSLVADMAVVLVVHQSDPARTVADLVSAAKRDPRKMNFSSPGAGSSLHLAIELFQRAAGVTLQHVPYKGGGEAVTAILSRQAHGMFANPPLVISHVRAGTIRALAVAGSARVPQFPDVPSTSEAGISGFDMSSWVGFVAPARTAASIVHRLSAQISKALREPDVQQRLVDAGVRPKGLGPDEFADFLRKDRAKWASIISSANIRLD
jgi:tripartite-type tricarboxylate transporter receptor subunit TctC